MIKSLRRLQVLLVMMGFGLLVLQLTAFAQFTEEELAERENWEAYLKEAKIVNKTQMQSRYAVTSPWVLTLEKDGVRKQGLWKDAEGRMKGFVENWRWEIAAYRMDKFLGLNMIPPTVEKRGPEEERGSCQLWIESEMNLENKERENVKLPSYKVFYWNRATYLQRAFDNLIANDDRHQRQILITKDWKMILIDHSRCFRSSKKYITKLINTEKSKPPKVMRQLPRNFVEKMKSLDMETVKTIVGEYLTEKEIQAMLRRRDLIIKEIDKLIKKYGEEDVLY